MSCRICYRPPRHGAMPIVASGGVSVGDHDVLKAALEKLGGTTMRSLRVAVKPGQHVAFALLAEQRVPAFGLPGNPVAALVTYELYVRPALRAMAGCQVLDRPRISAIAETDLPRRRGYRTDPEDPPARWPVRRSSAARGSQASASLHEGN